MRVVDIEHIRRTLAEIVQRTNNYHGPSATSWEAVRDLIQMGIIPFPRAA